MNAYKFRVILDTEEDVFRDIEVDQNDTFESFYKSIIQSFNFEGKELASFYMSNEKWDKGREIGVMDMGAIGGDENENLPAVMSRAILKEFVQEKDQKIILVYDFLRMWCFYIELQEETDNLLEEPKVILTYGNAPTEDSKAYDDPFEGIDLGEPEPKEETEKEKPDPMKSEIDDIMSEYDDLGDEPESFENIDDLDI